MKNNTKFRCKIDKNNLIQLKTIWSKKDNKSLKWNNTFIYYNNKTAQMNKEIRNKVRNYNCILNN